MPQHLNEANDARYTRHARQAADSAGGNAFGQNVPCRQPRLLRRDSGILLASEQQQQQQQQQWRGGRVGDFGEVFWRGGGGLFLIVCSIGIRWELRAEGDNSLEVSGWWSARDRSVGPVVINYESRTSPLISAIIGERVYWEWDSSWLKARCVEWEQGVGSTSLRKRSRVRAGCG